MFLRALSVEVQKARGHTALAALGVGCLAVAVIFPVAITLLGLVNPGYRALGADAMTPPRSVYAAAVFLRNFGPVLAVVVFATLFGVEYDTGMWEWILSRDVGRLRWFAAKLVAASAFCAATSVVSLGLWLMLAAIGARWLGGPSPDVATVAPAVGGYRAAFVMPIGLMAFYACATVLATIVWRSTIVGITAGLLVPTLIGFAAIRSTSGLLPLVHLRAIQRLLLGVGTSPDDPTLTVRLAILAVQVAVLLALAAHVFTRQEFTGARG